jgi:hypothetical protein
MSLHEYQTSWELYKQNLPFYALIMTAMRQADDVNSQKLKTMFPEVWEELELRYHAGGGVLSDELEKKFDRMWKGLTVVGYDPHDSKPSGSGG